MARLPQPGGDTGNWGTILNEFLSATHTTDGGFKPGVIQGSHLADGSVTTDKLADASITTTKLASSVQTTLSSVVTTSSLGVAGGIAGLDSSGKVPASQLPEASGGTTPEASATVSGTIRLSGDLGGTASSPTVTKLSGVSLSGTPSAGQALVATSSTVAGWQSISTGGSTNPNAGTVWNTASDPATGATASSVKDGDMWVDTSHATLVSLKNRINGQWVEVSSATKPVVQQPATSDLVTGLTVGSITSTGLTLSWTAPANPSGAVTGYNVYNEATKLTTTALSATTTTYNVTGLSAGTQYTFNVRTVVGSSESESVSVNATTTGTATQPGELKVGDSYLYPNYIGENTITKRSVASMPLVSNSANMATTIRQAQVSSGYFTTCSGPEYNFPTYIVDSTQGTPFATVTCDLSFSGGWGGPSQAMKDNLFTSQIPIPDNAEAAVGTDGAISIYDLGTGILRDYWIMKKVGDRQWTAQWGGFAHNALSKYTTQFDDGSTSGSGMMGAMYAVGIDEIRNGSINHAIAFALPNLRTGHSWPAKQGDGTSSDNNLPVAGQWCRINPDFDVDVQPYSPMLKTILKAGQQYGMVPIDKTFSTLSILTESGNREEDATGINPWADNSAFLTQYAQVDAYWKAMKDFPWEETQWAPIDWGKPA